MAAGFEVEPARLSALAKGLHDAVGAMSSAQRAMESASERQTGEASLDRACGDFRDKWGYGLQQLGKTTEALATGLDATAKAYGAVEDEVGRSFGGLAAGLGGAGRMQPGSAGPRSTGGQ